MAPQTATATTAYRYELLIDEMGIQDTPILKDLKQKMPRRRLSPIDTLTSLPNNPKFTIAECRSEQTIIEVNDWIENSPPNSIRIAPSNNTQSEEMVPEKTNKTRLELLARQFVGTLSMEEEARLEIVTERVRQLFPRVTPEDYEAIEDIMKDVNGMTEELNRLKRDLGITSAE